jgi:hypothetical protein
LANIYVDSAAVGAGTGADWANAYTTLSAALTGSNAGDDLWVASSHSESTAGAVTLTCPGTRTSPSRIISVNKAGSVPPVAADILTGATVATTGANAITIITAATGSVYYEGISFIAGDGANNASINIHTTTVSATQQFKNCSFYLRGSSGSARLTVGSTGSFLYTTVWDNCTVQFSSVSQYINLRHGFWTWQNTASAIAGATIPTILVRNDINSRVRWSGVDVSAASSGKTLFASHTMNGISELEGCRINNSVTLYETQAEFGGEQILSQVSGSALNYPLNRNAYGGSQSTSVTVYRTSGASQPDSQAVGWNINTNSSAKRLMPFQAIPISAWNATTGSSVTATIYGIVDAAAIPTNAQIWADIYYLGNASYPLMSVLSTAPATVLTTASNLTADTSAWDAGATTRANGQSYSIGDIIKVSSNTDRLFFCTTGGTSNGSLPAGYATAVDGDSVNDGGTAVFRAGWRFKIAQAFTPQLAGRVFVRLRVAVASTPRLYIDPKVHLS